MRRLALLVALTLLSVVNAHAQNTYRVFQGTAFVISAPSAVCGPGTSSNYDVGSYFDVVYRQKMNSGDPNDAMSFATPRALFRILSNNAAVNGLNGAQTTTNSYVNSRSNAGSGLAGSSSLTIAPAANGTLSTANKLTLLGTVDNFFGADGCTLSFRGVFVLRPDL